MYACLVYLQQIGHAFLLGTKYTQPLKTMYITADNESVLMEMGCYGIGVSRLLAAALEVSSTDKELRWPVSIAPYLLSILPPKVLIPLIPYLYVHISAENLLDTNNAVVDQHVNNVLCPFFDRVAVKKQKSETRYFRIFIKLCTNF